MRIKDEVLENMTVLEQWESSGMKRTLFLDRIVDTEFERVTHTILQNEFTEEWGEPELVGTKEHFRQKEVESKWLCIGGPNNGLRLTLKEARMRGYIPFNRADRSNADFKVILVHLRSVLLEPDVEIK